MYLYYIRHGDPDYAHDTLTPLGEEQARALAKRLLTYGVDEVYASPLGRARLTAKPLCDLLGKELTVCDWASESLAWADFTVPVGENAATWAFYHEETLALFHSSEVRALGEAWHTHPAFGAYPFTRGVERVNGAVDGFMESLGYRHDRTRGCYEVVSSNEKRVALFAHQGFGMCFMASLLDIPYPTYCTHFDFGHSSMTVVRMEEHGPVAYARALQLSNDSHLYKEGILTGYHNRFKF